MTEFVDMKVAANLETSVQKESSFEEKSSPIQAQLKPKLGNLPKNSKSWQSVQLGSPPMKKYEQDFVYKVAQEKSKDNRGLMKFEQPQSLDCEGVTPMIKITPMSDMESDSDSSMLHHLPVMDYLNPFCLQVIHDLIHPLQYNTVHMTCVQLCIQH